MTNKLKGEAALILEDGRRFTLVLDFDALIEAEATYRKPMHLMMADATAGFVGAVRALLFGALRRNHPQIGLGDVTELVRDHLDLVLEAVTAAVAASMPEPEGDNAGNAAADPPSAPAGNSSGGNGAKPD